MIRARVRSAARRHPGLTFVALPCLVLALVAGTVWLPGRTVPTSGGSVSVGEAPIPQDRVAPTFTLPRLSGSGSLSLTGLRGRVVVLNFWASWCTACHREVPTLSKLARDYRPSEVRFVGVDNSDRGGSGLAFARKSGMGYPSVVDRSGNLLNKYGAEGMPTTYVIDRTGHIRYEAIGTVESSALAHSIALVRAGHPAAPATGLAAVHLAKLSGSPAPDFTLIDQFGARFSLSDLHSTVVLLTFIDSRCTDVCPLTAQVLRGAVRRLGAAGQHVQLLAINANPDHFAVSDVRTWSAKHEMLHRWRFLTGQPDQLRRIWAAYGVNSHYEDGALVHESGIYVLDRNQDERALLSMGSQRASVTAEAQALAGAMRRLPDPPHR